jgi:serine/threonine protein kinase/formylglycine-generating enzyme required for sulfatase activity
MLNRSIGKYEILSELGRGAMGVVFRAHDPAIDRQVAIKVIRTPAFSSNEENANLRIRLMREARAAGRLSHPNIVTVYSLDEHEDFLYVVMEFVEGGSLDAHVGAGNPRPSNAIPILRQVADALDYAHSEGIIHRDIKPANILIGRGGRVKITDFGIAKIAAQTITVSGMTMGTPAYMSPEQARGERLDGRADQYSLAVVAFELLTGRRPFEAPSYDALLFKILTEAPVFPTEVEAALPNGCSTALLKGLSKRAGERYGKCTEFVDALERAFAPPSPRPQTVPEISPVLPPTAASSTLALTEMPPLLFVDTSAPTAAARLPPPASSTRLGRLIPAGVTLAVAVALVVWMLVAHRLAPVAGPLAREPSSRKEPPQAPAKAPAVGTARVNPKDGLTYVWIAPGTFMMGCSAGDSACFPDEKPAHQVTLTKGFWIGQTEVTQAAYQRVRGSNPSHSRGGSLPVETINWDRARAYCEAAGMRLPTEAEWEYAARGGQSSPRYGPLDAIVSFDSPVAQKQPNAYGLFDVIGNVEEWTADWFDAKAYASSPPVDPTGPARGHGHTVRGSSWTRPPWCLRVSFRDGPPYGVLWGTGVRCAGNELPSR